MRSTLCRIRQAGYLLSVTDGRLCYKPTPPAHVLDYLRRHKAEIILELEKEKATESALEAPQRIENDQADTNIIGAAGTPPALSKKRLGEEQAPPSDHAELVTERAAIREYDGGQPRGIAEAESLREVGPCFVCGGGRFWISRYGVIVCERCHPAADPRIVERTVVLPGWRSNE